jgi:penicillin-insensitive murein endopeptidase
MGKFQPKDERGYFMLPQAPEGAGYYFFGNVKDVPGTDIQVNSRTRI